MLLGLDLGTTNIKAAVADEAGCVLGRGSAPVQLFHLSDGGVEQDIGEIWNATRAAIQGALARLHPAAVRAVGVSSQGGALQLLDGSGRPFGRVISWLDGRGAAEDNDFTRRLGNRWFLVHIWHGRSGLALGQLLRLQRERPGCLEPPCSVRFVGDFVVERLCGTAAHDGTSCALTLLYNPQRRDYDAEVLAQLGLARTQLPELIFPSNPAGTLLPEMARELGLPAGIPVGPAVHDQYAAALGSGAVHAGDVMFGTGTAWVLLALSRDLPHPCSEEALVCHHLMEGCYGQILSLRNGGSAFQWALQLLGWERLESEGIDRQLEQVGAGSDGLLCRPLLGAFDAVGLVPGLRGQLDGLQLTHTRAHLLRSVVEGLTLELRRHLEMLRQPSAPIRRLVMTGGAAASRITPQIAADVTGLPITCLTGGESSLRGAVVLARALLPGAGGLVELAEDMMPQARAIEPGPAATIYDQLFARYLRTLSGAPASFT